MKYKTIEKTVTVKETVYEAIDGTIFTIKEECEKYDVTCEAIVKARFLSFSQRIDFDSIAYNGMYGAIHVDGCCDGADFYISEPKTIDDCNTIAQFIKVFGDGVDIAKNKADENYLALTLIELKPGEKYIVEIDEYWGGIYSEERMKSVFNKKITDAFHGEIKKEEKKQEETK